MYLFADCDIIGLPFFLIGGGSFLVGVTAFFICNLILTPFKVYVNTF
nr:MAG TPA: hypothetical protein [Bacteriophage sp.]